MADRVDVLERARREVGLTVQELWLRYFALGGMSSVVEIEAILYGALVGLAHDRDILAVALNERYAELGGDHLVPYSDDDDLHPTTWPLTTETEGDA